MIKQKQKEFTVEGILLSQRFTDWKSKKATTKKKKKKKRDKCLDLAREQRKLWKMRITMIPIVIIALGTVFKGLEKRVEELEIRGRIKTIQTTVLLISTGILRRILEAWRDLLSLRLQQKVICWHWWKTRKEYNDNDNMTEKKTTLTFFRNQDWKKVKVETENGSKLLPNIPTHDITELNELIYVGAKLVYDEIGVRLKNPNRNTKPGWEIKSERLEIATISESAEEEKKQGYVGIKRPKQNRRQAWQYNLKKLLKRHRWKKGDLKDTEIGSRNTNKTGHSKMLKENSTNKQMENARGHTNNQMQRKQNNFGVKYANRKYVTERLNG